VLAAYMTLGIIQWALEGGCFGLLASLGVAGLMGADLLHQRNLYLQVTTRCIVSIVSCLQLETTVCCWLAD
jgi:hypothetical protein